MPRRVGPDGRPLAWRAAGAGAPALLLHCMLAHSGAWSEVMAGLADRLAMRAPDLPGHGGTGYDPARRIQDQAADDARMLLDDRGPAHLVGHSFGGTVALRLAIDAPERALTLTLIEPVLFALLAETDPAAFAAETAAAAPACARMAAADWSGAAEAFLGRWGAPLAGASPAQAAALVAGMPLVAAAGADIADPATATLRRADLAAVRCPVLLIEGAQSPPAIGAILAGLAAAIPQARRVAVPGAGHMAPITHPEAVSDEIRCLTRARAPAAACD